MRVRGDPARLALSPRSQSGADDPTRTDDLLITSELLYQLSYVGPEDGLAVVTNSNPAPRGERRLAPAPSDPPFWLIGCAAWMRIPDVRVGHLPAIRRAENRPPSCRSVAGHRTAVYSD